MVLNKVSELFCVHHCGSFRIGVEVNKNFL